MTDEKTPSGYYILRLPGPVPLDAESAHLCWLGPNKDGFTTHLDEAGVYRREQIEAEPNRFNNELTTRAVPTEAVHWLLERHIRAEQLHRPPQTLPVSWLYALEAYVDGIDPPLGEEPPADPDNLRAILQRWVNKLIVDQQEHPADSALYEAYGETIARCRDTLAALQALGEALPGLDDPPVPDLDNDPSP